MAKSPSRLIPVVLAAPLLLAACASDRLAGAPPPTTGPSPLWTQPGPQFPSDDPDLGPPPPVEAPAAPIVTEPLPPPSVPGIPSQQPPTDPTLAAPPGTTPAAGTPPGTPVQTAAAPTVAAPAVTRSSLTGAWSARDNGGNACRVTLSSTPALDRYKANVSGCDNKDLARVNAWDFRDGEVYLFSADAVVARMRAQGSRSAAGSLARSGAPVTLSR